ncbi:MAG: hypothetical protein IJG54_08480 [Bacteroidales bacterium]|jgi:phosphoribosylformimino-5-aminoimidazole carboxamide ribotide isomerase|nr:hypothetical protein [Bacteroidales bacterium]
MMQIIPSIQLLGQKVVTFPEGNLKKMKSYDIDILDYIQDAEIAGIKRICLVDISGARSNAPQSLDVLKRITSTTRLKVTFGGGIKSRDSLRNAQDNGADHLISSSIAVLQPTVFNYWCECYEPNNIIFSADITPEGLAVKGWKEKSAQEVKESLRKMVSEGLKKVILRDVSKEGTLSGPNLDLVREIAQAFPKLVIAVRGGISSIEDIDKLSQAGAHCAIIGTAILEDKLTFSQINDYYSRGKDEQEK